MLLNLFLPWPMQFTYPKPQRESELESGLKYTMFLHTDCKPWLTTCTWRAVFQILSHSTLQPTTCVDSPCWSLAGLRASLTPLQTPSTPPPVGAHLPTATGLPDTRCSYDHFTGFQKSRICIKMCSGCSCNRNSFWGSQVLKGTALFLYILVRYVSEDRSFQK